MIGLNDEVMRRVLSGVESAYNALAQSVKGQRDMKYR